MHKTSAVALLARLFLKKTSRYCHSPGVGLLVVSVMRKLRNFLISLLLLKIFT